VRQLLRHIDFSFNELTDVGMEIFAKLLERCSSLESLNLQGNALGPASAERLSASLAGCEGLKYLNLQYNRVGTAGAIVATPPLRALPSTCCFRAARRRGGRWRS
jgi:Ran GTPase-activating protein (RanGAP) involved in mRNA processing and transport